MKFEKGRSGNPGGRPKGFERLTREIVAEHKKSGDVDGWECAIKELADIAFDHDIEPKVRIAALKLLKEWGFGLSRQKVEIGGGLDIGPRVDMRELTEDELRAIAKLDIGDGDPVH